MLKLLRWLAAHVQYDQHRYNTQKVCTGIQFSKL